MNPSKIVITGTIASGKSTLSSLLTDLGFTVLSADEINRKLLEVGGRNYQAIKNSPSFDDAFIGENLDKKKLAKIIFSDEDKLLELNQLTHKNIINELEKTIDSLNEKVVFVEIPLYFQMKEKFACDEVWLVTANHDTQVERLMDRDNIDSSYAEEKIEKQKEQIQMQEQSDVVFDNSGSVADLIKELKIVLEKKDLLWKF